jgi:hypothetical protein
MTDQQLKDNVLAAQQALTDAIAAARQASIIVNLWVYGTGPTQTGSSQVGLEFGDTV